MRAIFRDLGAALFYASIGMATVIGVATVVTFVRHPLVRYAVDQAVTGDVEAFTTPRRR